MIDYCEVLFVVINNFKCQLGFMFVCNNIYMVEKFDQIQVWFFVLCDCCEELFVLWWESVEVVEEGLLEDVVVNFCKKL